MATHGRKRGCGIQVGERRAPFWCSLESVTVHVIGPGAALAVVGATLVVRDMTAPTPDTVAAIGNAAKELAAAYPDGFTLLYVTGPSEGGSLPDEASRNAVLNTLRAYKAQLRAIGYVVLLRGILASTMRSVGSAILYAARIPFPTRIFAELPEGIDWIVNISEKVGVAAPSREQLAKVTDEMLDRLTKAPLTS